jgi:hypothetical protein
MAATMCKQRSQSDYQLVRLCERGYCVLLEKGKGGQVIDYVT